MANLLKTSAFLGTLNEFEEKHAPEELYYEGNKNFLHEKA